MAAPLPDATNWELHDKEALAGTFSDLPKDSAAEYLKNLREGEKPLNEFDEELNLPRAYRNPDYSDEHLARIGWTWTDRLRKAGSVHIPAVYQAALDLMPRKTDQQKEDFENEKERIYRNFQTIVPYDTPIKIWEEKPASSLEGQIEQAFFLGLTPDQFATMYATGQLPLASYEYKLDMLDKIENARVMHETAAENPGATLAEISKLALANKKESDSEPTDVKEEAENKYWREVLVAHDKNVKVWELSGGQGPEPNLGERIAAAKAILDPPAKGKLTTDTVEHRLKLLIMDDQLRKNPDMSLEDQLRLFRSLGPVKESSVPYEEQLENRARNDWAEEIRRTTGSYPNAAETAAYNRTLSGKQAEWDRQDKKDREEREREAERAREAGERADISTITRIITDRDTETLKHERAMELEQYRAQTRAGLAQFEASRETPTLTEYLTQRFMAENPNATFEQASAFWQSLQGPQPQQSAEQMMARNLREANFDPSHPSYARAQAIFDFINQPTELQRLDKALEVARSPGDLITLMQMYGGDLPPGPLPQSRAFSLLQAGLGPRTGMPPTFATAPQPPVQPGGAQPFQVAGRAPTEEPPLVPDGAASTDEPPDESPAPPKYRYYKVGEDWFRAPAFADDKYDPEHRAMPTADVNLANIFPGGQNGAPGLEGVTTSLKNGVLHDPGAEWIRVQEANRARLEGLAALAEAGIGPSESITSPTDTTASLSATSPFATASNNLDSVLHFPVNSLEEQFDLAEQGAMLKGGPTTSDVQLETAKRRDEQIALGNLLGTQSFDRGGVASGFPGQKVIAQLEVGETVRTPFQEARIQARLARANDIERQLSQIPSFANGGVVGVETPVKDQTPFQEKVGRITRQNPNIVPESIIPDPTPQPDPSPAPPPPPLPAYGLSQAEAVKQGIPGRTRWWQDETINPGGQPPPGYRAGHQAVSAAEQERLWRQGVRDPWELFGTGSPAVQPPHVSMQEPWYGKLNQGYFRKQPDPNLRFESTPPRTDSDLWGELPFVRALRAGQPVQKPFGDVVPTITGFSMPSPQSIRNLSYTQMQALRDLVERRGLPWEDFVRQYERTSGQGASPARRAVFQTRGVRR